MIFLPFRYPLMFSFNICRKVNLRSNVLFQLLNSKSLLQSSKILYLKNVRWFSLDTSCWSRFSRCGTHHISTSRKESRNGYSGVIKSNGNGKLKRTRLKLKELKETTKHVTKTIQKENVLTVPNGLCLLRIGLTPILAYLVFDGSYFAALSIFIFAGITDLLDGFIARTFSSQQSMIGSFLDPMADKFLVATLFLSLTIVGLIPIPLTALIVARDACLVIAGFYIRYHSLPPPKTLSRYFDVTFATAKLSPTLLSKINTALQLTLAAVTLASPVFHYVDHPYIHGLWYCVACTTVMSGASYIFVKNTYQFLHTYTKKRQLTKK